MPGIADFSVRVTSLKEAFGTIFTAGVEPFLGHGQQPSHPGERIAFSTSMTQRLVLNTARTSSSRCFTKRVTWKGIGYLQSQSP